MASMLVAKAYGIDVVALTYIDQVRVGIDAVVNIMSDEKTYMEAKEIVEKEGM